MGFCDSATLLAESCMRPCAPPALRSGSYFLFLTRLFRADCRSASAFPPVLIPSETVGIFLLNFSLTRSFDPHSKRRLTRPKVTTRLFRKSYLDPPPRLTAGFQHGKIKNFHFCRFSVLLLLYQAAQEDVHSKEQKVKLLTDSVNSFISKAPPTAHDALRSELDTLTVNYQRLCSRLDGKCKTLEVRVQFSFRLLHNVFSREMKHDFIDEGRIFFLFFLCGSLCD